MAFIKGRHIIDGPLLVNEIISWAKKHKKKLLLLKVDFEKAFDSLSWSFLQSIMAQMGFGEKWRKWIHSCLNSAFASVLINGSPTSEFKLERGLRQGDPLSPFLFILAVEALNVVFLEARNKSIFLGAEVGKDKVPISHLQFADDALIVGHWSLPNARNLSRILTCFHLASGLKINFNKSKLFGIGVSSSEVNSIASSIGCQPSLLPCTYLGLPIGANMSRYGNWSSLIDRFQKRLSNWKTKTLSYGGRLTLIKSVLGSLGVYFFSTFKAPISILKKLESIRRDFFWGGSSDTKKIAWIAWDKVIGPREQGGLGIGSLKIFNQAMLAKWWWRFLLEENALWRKTIVSIHGTCGGLRVDSSSPYKSGPWYHIMRLKDDLSTYGVTLPLIFKRKVGNGASTRFWVDQWLGGPPLCSTFPRLYRLETNNLCFVCDRAPKISPNIVVPPGSIQSPSSQLDIPHPPGLIFSWAWLRPLRSEAERHELSELISLLSGLYLTSEKDYWECSISDNRVFSVKSMRSYISNLHYTANPQPYRWNKAIPIKVNISSWRILNERLPTRSNLDQRGIDLHSTRCPVCDNDIETEVHLFIFCEVALDTWSKVLTWWKIQNITITSLLDALTLADRVNLPSHNVSLFDAVVQSTFWFLWKFRNDMVFSLKRPSRNLILNDIKLASFNWVYSRVKKGRLSWIDWVVNSCNTQCN